LKAVHGVSLVSGFAYNCKGGDASMLRIGDRIGNVCDATAERSS
jgi:hypothetical protein